MTDLFFLILHVPRCLAVLFNLVAREKILSLDLLLHQNYQFSENTWLLLLLKNHIFLWVKLKRDLFPFVYTSLRLHEILCKYFWGYMKFFSKTKAVFWGTFPQIFVWRLFHRIKLVVPAAHQVYAVSRGLAWTLPAICLWHPACLHWGSWAGVLAHQ